MIIVTPKETCVLSSKSNEKDKRLSIYLGGSINYDWQSKVISKIANSSIDYGKDTVVYNPRKMYDSNNSGCHELLYDESWRDKCLKKSDVVIVNFVPGCEDGLYFLTNSELRDHLVVLCPHEHKHFNTVKYICMEYGIHFVTENIINENNILESLYEFINK